MSKSANAEGSSRLDALRAAMRESWQRGDRVLVEGLLKRTNESLSEVELLQLIASEFQLRRRWGDTPTDGSYAARFPMLKERLLPLLSKVRAAMAQRDAQAAANQPAPNAPKPALPVAIPVAAPVAVVPPAPPENSPSQLLNMFAEETDSESSAAANEAAASEAAESDHSEANSSESATSEPIDDIAGLADAFQSSTAASQQSTGSHSSRRVTSNAKGAAKKPAARDARQQRMMIGGGIAAVVLIGIAAVSFSRPGKTKPSVADKPIAKAGTKPKSKKSQPKPEAMTATDPAEDAKSNVAKQPIERKDLVKQVERGVVRLDAWNAHNEPLGQGTGFVFDASGLVATNFHVVERSSKVVATFKEGKKVEVKGLRAWDQEGDLAILELSEVDKFVQVLPLNQSIRREQADDITAIGYPQGLEFVITRGIISAIHRTDQLPPRFREGMEAPDHYVWVQTDAAISPGSSGGPLMDKYGEVIGVNTWVTKDSKHSFAVDVRHLRELQRRMNPEAVALSEITGPLDELGRLWGEFVEVSRSVNREALRAKTRAEMLAVLEQRHPAVEFLPKLNQLADRYRRGHVALPSWSLMCRMVAGPCPVKCDETLLAAADRILQSPLRDDERLIPSITLLRLSRLSAAQTTLKRFMQESKNLKIRSWAEFALASSQRLATKEKPSDDAIASLTQLQENYGSLDYHGIPLGALCELELFQAKFMSPGCVPPEISGRDHLGQEFRLSDYRGKIVVIDVWADAALEDTEMYEFKQQLQEKYKDRPVVLLGVNYDDPGDFRDLVAKRKIGWRNWLDGDEGRILQAWRINLDHLPSSYYVIDHDGVLRDRDVPFAELAGVIDGLLAKAPSAGKAE